MSKRQDYIDQYASAAMEQMKRYGIPASVILAQGIIESGNGQSQLSQLYNNHFGIKATQKWLDGGGQYAVYTDDKPNEKFCAYASVVDSYEHHSQFLKENTRYAELFQLSPDDHEGWAKGLQKAGYASSRSYAQTIEAVIKANGLDKYDSQVMQEMEGKEFGIAANPRAELPNTMSSDPQHYSFPIDCKEFMLVTSTFGMRTDPMDHSKQQNHKGVDIRANNVPLMATEDGGKVISVCRDAGTTGGRSVTVEYGREDGSKFRVFCCHLDQVNVNVGDVVNAGQQLGVTGNTGTRTTGPHLHLGVKQVSAEGEIRDIDPASYFADIAVKGGIQQSVMYNGENLLDKYITPEQRQPQVDEVYGLHQDNPDEADIHQAMDPQDWMKRLLTSEDAGASMSADPIMDMIVSLFGSLMALALQIDNRSQADKMQVATDVALNRRIDLTGLVPGVQNCVLTWPQDGKPQLTMKAGDQTVIHQLTDTETNNLNAVLSDGNRNDAEKQLRLSSLVGQIVIQQQVSNNYNEQIGQGESQGLQR